MKKIALTLATGLGISYAHPRGRGTLGAFVGLIMVPLFSLLTWPVQLIVTICLVGIAIWSASIAEAHFGTKDDGRIVIDEIVSVFITFLGYSLTHITVPFLAVGFILNRVFDVIKLYPAQNAETLSGGVGIVLDDVISGIYSWVILFLVSSLLF